MRQDGSVVDAHATDWPSALVGVQPGLSAARAADKPTGVTIRRSLNSGSGQLAGFAT